MLLTGTGLVQSPSRDVHVALAEQADGAVVLDLDWRPMLWSDRRTYAAYVQALLPWVDLVLGSASEFEAFRPGPAVGTARSLLDVGPRMAVVKRGADGCVAVDVDGEEEIEGLPVEVVNGLGAGDAFCASLLAGLTGGLTLAEACRRGNAAGAIVASRLSCSEAMPTAAEVDELLATGAVPAQAPGT